MIACANCLRLKIGDDWQPDKLPRFFFLVKPYRRVKYEICPECERVRSGEMVVVCSNCLRLRNDANEWIDIDFDRTYRNASDGICPDCARILYPDHYKDMYPDLCA